MLLRTGIYALVSVRTFDLVSLGYVCRSGIAGSYGESVFNFSEETPDYFSTVAESSYIPTSNV